MKKYESADDYIDSLEQWKPEMVKLRSMMLSLGIEETLKWSIPVYATNGKNVAGIIAFKNYFGIWFYQGALMKDNDNVLINAQEGKTKAMRQWRFTSIKELKVRKIKEYVLEAVALAEQGIEIKPNRNKPLNIPAELAKALAAKPKARKAFEALSKSCKREYTEYIYEAKKEETKLRRLEKIIPMILDSNGLHDKYRST